MLTRPVMQPTARLAVAIAAAVVALAIASSTWAPRAWAGCETVAPLIESFIRINGGEPILLFADPTLSEPTHWIFGVDPAIPGSSERTAQVVPFDPIELTDKARPLETQTLVLSDAMYARGPKTYADRINGEIPQAPKGVVVREPTAAFASTTTTVATGSNDRFRDTVEDIYKLIQEVAVAADSKLDQRWERLGSYIRDHNAPASSGGTRGEAIHILTQDGSVSLGVLQEARTITAGKDAKVRALVVSSDKGEERLILLKFFRKHHLNLGRLRVGLESFEPVVGPLVELNRIRDTAHGHVPMDWSKKDNPILRYRQWTGERPPTSDGRYIEAMFRDPEGLKARLTPSISGEGLRFEDVPAKSAVAEATRLARMVTERIVTDGFVLERERPNDPEPEFNAAQVTDAARDRVAGKLRALPAGSLARFARDHEIGKRLYATFDEVRDAQVSAVPLAKRAWRALGRLVRSETDVQGFDLYLADLYTASGNLLRKNGIRSDYVNGVGRVQARESLRVFEAEERAIVASGYRIPLLTDANGKNGYPLSDFQPVTDPSTLAEPPLVQSLSRQNGRETSAIITRFEEMRPEEFTAFVTESDVGQKLYETFKLVSSSLDFGDALNLSNRSRGYLRFVDTALQLADRKKFAAYVADLFSMEGRAMRARGYRRNYHVDAGENGRFLYKPLTPEVEEHEQAILETIGNDLPSLVTVGRSIKMPPNGRMRRSLGDEVRELLSNRRRGRSSATALIVQDSMLIPNTGHDYALTGRKLEDFSMRQLLEQWGSTDLADLARTNWMEADIVAQLQLRTQGVTTPEDHYLYVLGEIATHGDLPRAAAMLLAQKIAALQSHIQQESAAAVAVGGRERAIYVMLGETPIGKLEACLADRYSTLTSGDFSPRSTRLEVREVSPETDLAIRKSAKLSAEKIWAGFERWSEVSETERDAFRVSVARTVATSKALGSDFVLEREQDGTTPDAKADALIGVSRQGLPLTQMGAVSRAAGLKVQANRHPQRAFSFIESLSNYVLAAKSPLAEGIRTRQKELIYAHDRQLLLVGGLHTEGPDSHLVGLASFATPTELSSNKRLTEGTLRLKLIEPPKDQYSSRFSDKSSGTIAFRSSDSTSSYANSSVVARTVSIEGELNQVIGQEFLLSQRPELPTIVTEAAERRSRIVELTQALSETQAALMSSADFDAASLAAHDSSPSKKLFAPGTVEVLGKSGEFLGVIVESNGIGPQARLTLRTSTDDRRIITLADVGHLRLRWNGALSEIDLLLEAAKVAPRRASNTGDDLLTEKPKIMAAVYALNKRFQELVDAPGRVIGGFTSSGRPIEGRVEGFISLTRDQRLVLRTESPIGVRIMPSGELYAPEAIQLIHARSRELVAEAGLAVLQRKAYELVRARQEHDRNNVFDALFFNHRVEFERSTLDDDLEAWRRLGVTAYAIGNGEKLLVTGFNSNGDFVTPDARYPAGERPLELNRYFLVPEAATKKPGWQPSRPEYVALQDVSTLHDSFVGMTWLHGFWSPRLLSPEEERTILELRTKASASWATDNLIEVHRDGTLLGYLSGVDAKTRTYEVNGDWVDAHTVKLVQAAHSLTRASGESHPGGPGQSELLGAVQTVYNPTLDPTAGVYVGMFGRDGHYMAKVDSFLGSGPVGQAGRVHDRLATTLREYLEFMEAKKGMPAELTKYAFNKFYREGLRRTWMATIDLVKGQKGAAQAMLALFDGSYYSKTGRLNLPLMEDGGKMPSGAVKQFFVPPELRKSNLTDDDPLVFEFGRAISFDDVGTRSDQIVRRSNKRLWLEMATHLDALTRSEGRPAVVYGHTLQTITTATFVRDYAMSVHAVRRPDGSWHTLDESEARELTDYLMAVADRTSDGIPQPPVLAAFGPEGENSIEYVIRADASQIIEKFSSSLAARATAGNSMSPRDQEALNALLGSTDKMHWEQSLVAYLDRPSSPTPPTTSWKTIVAKLDGLDLPKDLKLQYRSQILLDLAFVRGLTPDQIRRRYASLAQSDEGSRRSIATIATIANHEMQELRRQKDAQDALNAILAMLHGTPDHDFIQAPETYSRARALLMEREMTADELLSALRREADSEKDCL